MGVLSYSTREVQNRLDMVGSLQEMVSSPYNFKGAVATLADLPASGTVNDTYYVEAVKYRVTWTGSAWVQSSMNESDYEDELLAIENQLNEITGLSDSATVTSGISRTTNGVTFETESEYTLKMYGTATAGRRIIFLNGQDLSATTGASFSQTLPAGIYYISLDVTGYRAGIGSIRATYSKFSNEFTVLTAGDAPLYYTFTAPVMLGFLVGSGGDFGTEENPTYVTFHAQKLVPADCVMFTEQSLTSAQAQQARENIDCVGNETLYKHNFYDVFELAEGVSRTTRGVEYIRNDDNSWTISGTADGEASFCNVVSSASAVPRYIIPGRKYRFSFNGGTVPIQIFVYKNGESTYFTYSSDFEYTFPSDMDGVIIRFRVSEGVSVNETVRYTFSPESGTPNCVQYSVQSLTSAESEQARDNIDCVGNDTLYQYNYYDVFKLGNRSGSTLNGVEYIRNADYSWTISGRADGGASFSNIISSSSAVPRYIIPGRKYKFSFNGGTVPIQIFIYKNGESTSSKYTTDFEYTFPVDMDGVIIRFFVAEGDTVGETVRYTFIPETVTSIDNNYTYNTTVEKTVQTYNNTYNITTTPTITTDSNGWLQAVDTDTQDETGKTDMAGPIMSMLNSTGYCHLGEGIFYVSGIDMPEGSMLCGCGEKTTIRLLSSVSNGYAVKIEAYNTIRDIKFSGSYSSLTPTTDGKRNAINFVADYDGTDTGTAYTTYHCMISDVWIHNFSGSGIYCHNTSISVSKGLEVVNAYILRCYAGINIDYYSEFHHFTNINTSGCYYGCINNGGNNVFTACIFGANYCGFHIDGTQPNAAHGTVNGCTFCHVGSNNGFAIKVNDIAPGYIFANCQIWYCKIEVENCQGVLFDGCVFGRGITDDGAVSASISISGGNLVLFDGCVFHLDATRPPKITITNNTKTVFQGCYGSESGNAIKA